MGPLPEADDVEREQNLYSFFGLRESVFLWLPVEVETWLVSIFFVRQRVSRAGLYRLSREEEDDESGIIENRGEHRWRQEHR